MKKGVGLFFSVTLILLLVLVSSISVISAADTNTSSTSLAEGFEKGYSCLKGKLNSTSLSGLSLEAVEFSLMAMGYDTSLQSSLKAELLSRKDTTNDCWPKGGCTLKETALAFFALDNIGYDTTNLKNWILNQTTVPSDIIWYLQIEQGEQTQCTLTYDGNQKTVTINEDKTITGSPGSCLRISSNGFWLEILPSCYGKEIKVSCNKQFLTSTMFKRTTEDTLYISETTQTREAGSDTTVKVESLCFKQGNSCNFEGSLWATWVANKKDSKIVDKVLPYLMTSASLTSNARYLPSAFLYTLTGSNDYFNELVNLQKKDGYWQVGSNQLSRYYDTSIALLSINGKAGQAEVAKDYLIGSTVQQPDGCWNGDNIRDTAFILYAANPKPGVTTNNIAVRSQCNNFPGYSCLDSSTCRINNGSDMGTNFACSLGYICCNATVKDKTCAEQSGEICTSGEICDGGAWKPASGTSYCCVGGDCKAQTTTDNQCSNQGSQYNCRAGPNCNSGETPENFDCPNSDEVCCFQDSVSGGTNYWWIILLVLLIILLALAIIFRNQLKIWLFKIKNKFSKGPVTNQERPQFPPAPQPRPFGAMPPRRIIPGQPRRPMPTQPLRRPFPKDRELDDTLKKLKEMGK